MNGPRWRSLSAREALEVDIELSGDDYDLPRKVHIAAQGAKYRLKLERLKSIVDFGH